MWKEPTRPQKIRMHRYAVDCTNHVKSGVVLCGLALAAVGADFVGHRSSFGACLIFVGLHIHADNKRQPHGVKHIS